MVPILIITLGLAVWVILVIVGANVKHVAEYSAAVVALMLVIFLTSLLALELAK